jgi:MFS transporter, DHA1 family, multidrug resistance protein
MAHVPGHATGILQTVPRRPPWPSPVARIVTVPDPAPARPSLRAPGVVLFLAFVDVFALLPTVAPHVAGLGAGPAGIGLAVGAYSAANLPANIVGGILVDRRGRRIVTIVGLVAAALTVAAYALATSVGGFILVRLLHGVAGGILVPAVFAAAGDRARRGAEGRAFGRLGAVIGSAAVIAPASAGAVRQATGTDSVFLGVAALLLLGAVVAYFGVHDPPTELPPAPTERASRPQAMRALLRVAPIRRALLGTTVLTAAVGVLAGFLPGTAEALGAPASAVGGLFTAYAVVAAGIMLSPVSGRVDRSGADGPLALGLLTLGAALLLLSVAPTLAIAVVGSALFGAGYGLIFPAVTAATSSSSTVATRGRAFGLFNVAFSLGLAVGPPLIGALAEAVPAVDPFVPTAVLAVAAALAITATAGRGPGMTHVDEALDELGGPPAGP